MINKNKNPRAELLKSYIHRLNEGESLESVRKDFVEAFEMVEASEIAIAEQEMIQDGMPISEVQKLCDIHSALFHGATREEQIANADKAVAESFARQAEAGVSGHGLIHQMVAGEANTALALSKIEGHPVHVFTKDNEKIQDLLNFLKEGLEKEETKEELMLRLEKTQVIHDHYARKGDLIYPLLSVGYGFSGPSDVMWGVDGEIRAELRILALGKRKLDDYHERLEAAIVRAEEMIYKENNILYPLCGKNFTKEEWMRIYYDMAGYPPLFADEYPIWAEAEEQREDLKTIGGKLAKDSKDAEADDFISIGSGQMTREQIESVLNTIPMELTFVDHEDINRYFNDDGKEKFFKRPDMAIGRDVHTCHPPHVQAMVMGIINRFRDGLEDTIEIWMEKKGEPVLVLYLAVRNAQGDYLGTLECVQKMGFATKHFEQQAKLKKD